MSTHTNGTSNGTAPKITLYTNHQCPYAHRAHVALKELGLPYEEVIIDLDKSREQWYLNEVNSRGLVPAIKYSNGVVNDEVITESSIITQFLADSQPSHLLPASNDDPTSALTRARINWFVDTWNTKIGSFLFQILKAEGDEQDAKAKELLAAVEKEIEPHLHNAAPFFNGSKNLTLAEVNISPFLLRLYALSRHGQIPPTVAEQFDALPNFSKWAKATTAQESVTYIWDEQKIVERMKARIAKLKATAK